MRVALPLELGIAIGHQVRPTLAEHHLQVRRLEADVLEAVDDAGRARYAIPRTECGLRAMAGGVLGCFGAWALFSNVDIYTLTRGFFIKFEVTPHILTSGLLIAAGLGIVSCLVPAYTNLKTTVVEGLRELD